jgi:hypothetical protein
VKERKNEGRKKERKKEKSRVSVAVLCKKEEGRAEESEWVMWTERRSGVDRASVNVPLLKQRPRATCNEPAEQVSV